MRILTILVLIVAFTVPCFSQEPAEEVKMLRNEITILKNALSKTEMRLANLEAKMAIVTPPLVVAETKVLVQSVSVSSQVQSPNPRPLTFFAKSYLGYRAGFSDVPNAFDIYRGYFGFTYRLVPRVTFTATLDSAARRDDKGYFGVVLKNLFLDFEHHKNHHLQLGQADVYWVPYMENLVGDRYIQLSFTEAEGYTTSTDMGIFLKGAFIQNRIQYGMGLINGNGWHRLETNSYKDIGGRVTFLPFANSKKLQKGIFVSLGAIRKFYDRNEVSQPETNVGYRLHALGGYQSNDLTAGLEILKTADPASKVVAAQPSVVSLKEAKGAGYSVFANLKLRAFLPPVPENAGMLARFDWHDPTKGVVAYDSHARLMLGPTWTVNKNLWFFAGYLGIHYDKNAKVQRFSQNLFAFSAEAKF